MVRRLLGTLAAAVLLLSAGHVSGQAPEPIRYTLRFPAPHTHYVEVEAAYPTGRQPAIEIYMAVWTPGSYLVREYERNVEGVTATADGRTPLAIEKTRKNRWRITTGGAASVTVRYRVYSREMTVRNNWVEAGFAMLNGAPTFLTLLEKGPRSHEVRLDLPPAWKTASTPLIPVAGSATTYRAEDFDTLVDSPIIAGNSVIREFTVEGKHHYLVSDGDPAFFDSDRAAADVPRIVVAASDVMGPILYPHYYFFNMVTGSGGGLEHKNSFLGMTTRYTTRTRETYLGWLSLVSHEYFHNWNVKRLRPVELGPFDYENENYVKTLWVAEGFTDYYADLLLRRAGLVTREEYLTALSSQIESVQTTPGRLVTPVNMASYDAWIKGYRPDENTNNTTISYYPKGAVIGFLLDARIRRDTNGVKTLDDGMRLALSRYAGTAGYTADQFYQVMSEVAGEDLKPFFAKAVESTDELDFSDALAYFGLRFQPADLRSPKAELGAGTKQDNGRLLVTSVGRSTPAMDAGLNVDDEIVAIDDVRVRADGLDARLDQYRPGNKVTVLVARRDRLMKIELTLSAAPAKQWRLSMSPASTEQRARLTAWMGQ